VAASAITFGQLLRDVRIQAEMNQADVAAGIGCSQKTISNFELGRRFPHVGVLYDICYALGISHTATVEMLNVLAGEGHLIKVSDCACEECRDRVEIG